MPSRLEVCQTREAGGPCEYFTETAKGVACRRVRCCHDPDTPSPVQFRIMLHSRYARCPHPAGDAWAGAGPVETASRGSARGVVAAAHASLAPQDSPPVARPDEGTTATDTTERGRIELLQYRLTICYHGCPDYRPGVRCRHAGALMPQIGRPEWACPAGRFGAAPP